jgi:hypothetical protein
MTKHKAMRTKSHGGLDYIVLYRFNEGFTNAVRRSVTMDTLLKPQG